MNWEELQKYYLFSSKKIVKQVQNDFPDKKLTILKIDIHNELHSLPCEGGIANNLDGETFLVDIDHIKAHGAKKKHPNLNIIVGDIRKLPFRRRMFDIVIDLSTIDHIHISDLPQVLSEYSRVLNSDGSALILSWCSNIREVYNKPKEAGSDVQYYFELNNLKTEVGKLFNILGTQTSFTSIVKGLRVNVEEMLELMVRDDIDNLIREGKLKENVIGENFLLEINAKNRGENI